jgi:hypothetical protein
MLTNELLDEILHVISSLTPDNPKSSEIIFLDKDLSNRDRQIILWKLIKDGFIDSMLSIQEANGFPNDMTLYFITFDGILHLQDGGYVGKIASEEGLKEELAILRKEQRDNNEQMVVLQKKVSFATTCAAIFSAIYLILTLAVYCNSQFSFYPKPAQAPDQSSKSPLQPIPPLK